MYLQKDTKHRPKGILSVSERMPFIFQTGTFYPAAASMRYAALRGTTHTLAS